jgi:two-component system chemotaxis response regulator CheB
VSSGVSVVRVVIVDDSALSREALRHAIELDPRLTVVAEARSGEEALSLANHLRPDLVTMDLQMPGMGGLKAIERLMAECPTPVVVISERASTSAIDLNQEAMSRGALELIPKSRVFGGSEATARAFAAHLFELARSGTGDDEPTPAPVPGPVLPPATEAPLLLGLGASTGGPKAVARLLNDLPADFPLPIALVQHMAEDFFESFVRFLHDATGRRVEIARAGSWLEPGRVVVAPPRQELFIREDLSVKLVPPPPNALISPSVDSLFFSMANSIRGRGVGVLLTGMGDDGAQGLLRMRRMGARTIVQDRASCAVYGMPRAALEVGAAETVMPLDAMGAYLGNLANQTRVSRPQPLRSTGTAAPPATRRRVLVVDEEASALLEARRQLERAGFEVETLDNPLILAHTLRRTQVDLVLLETELSTMKGAVVMQTLRNHGLATVPVFIYSALEPSLLKARMRECGAAGFVRKGTSVLVREVSDFLGGPRKPPER